MGDSAWKPSGMARSAMPARRSKRHRPNPQLAKIHRCYTIEEVAKLYELHRNTVRMWIKQGLPTIDDKRPILILGRGLRAFLQARRSMNKRPCKPGEIYCVRCRVPRNPAGDMADYEPLSGFTGNLIAICPVCECTIYQRVNLAQLEHVRGILVIKVVQAPERLGESSHPSVNSDFGQETATDDNTQCDK